MRYFLLTVTSLFSLLLTHAQVAVSNDGSLPHASAMLEVKSINRGFLLPRLVNRTDVNSPATGLLVYETASNAVWVYNGSGWIQLGSGGSGTQWLTNGTHLYNSNTGNIGIGISAPASKLHLVGNMLMDATNATLQLQTSGVDKGFLQLSGDNLRIGTNSSNNLAKFIIRTGGADRFFVDSIGQVGIGKSVPKFDLDVYGNARIQTTSGYGKSTLSLYANPYYLNDPYGPAGVTFFNWVSMGNNDYDYEAKFRLELQGGAAERLRLNHVDFENQLVLSKTGNVGINSSTPSEKLEVIGNMQVENVNPLLKLRRTSQLTIGDFGLQFNSSSNTTLANIMYSDGKLKLNHGATAGNDFVINGSSIGLGTDDPQEKLHIVGGNVQINSFNPVIKLQQANVDKGFVDLSSDDFRLGTFAGNTAGSVRVRVNGQERMNISPDGTTNLVNGLDASLTSNGFLMLGSASASNIVIDNNEILSRNNGIAATLTLQNEGGAVRIGNATVPAGYRLGVSGKVICEELRVKLSSNWPDYVFSKNYKLLPLTDLQRFIQQNNHLPNIPSAFEVEKNGIAVGEMQKKLVEKIEELTLYILELEQRLSKLENKSVNVVNEKR
ncbi:MAG: hypothetical protein EON98_00780 [Chitinophagaceae bacterium]|nr:MAG: hypothetical protein EON98_00780 [Chitinophagaceae bacterium]